MKQDRCTEKRRYPRINNQIRFEIRDNDNVVIADMINLSCIGAYCRVNKPVPLMTSLRIVLPLIYKNRINDVKYVECEGTVVRTERILTEDDCYHIAIFFSDIAASEQKKITDYIEAHQPSAADASSDVSGARL